MLAPTAEPQSLQQSVEDIPAGESREASWICVATLRATTTSVAPTRQSSNRLGYRFVSRPSQRSHLRSGVDRRPRMIVDAESAAYQQHPYNVRVGLENVSDRPVYNVAVELKTEGKQNYIYQPRERLVQSVAIDRPRRDVLDDVRVGPVHLRNAGSE